MLDLVGNHVRYVVIMIFLATLLEMILPQGVFRRYLRVLVGILLIFALLAPIKNIMDISFHWEIPANLSGEGKEEELVSLLDKGEKKYAKSMEQALELYRYRLFALLQEELAQKFGLEILQLEVALEEDPARKDFGSLQELSLVVRDREAGNKENFGVQGGIRGAEVEEIKILVKVFPPGKNPSQGDFLLAEAALKRDHFQLEDKKVAEFLASYLQLSEEKVNVEILP